MYRNINILLLSDSYLILKSLPDLIINYFKKINVFSEIEQFDQIMSELEKNQYNLLFIDEQYYQKNKFFLEKFKDKVFLVIINNNKDINLDDEKIVYLDICSNKNLILKFFENLTSSINSLNQSEKDENKELTAREKLILQMIAKGMTTKSIADNLGLSIQTVSTHRKNISQKLEIKTVSGLTLYAILNNLITLDESNL